MNPLRITPQNKEAINELLASIEKNAYVHHLVHDIYALLVAIGKGLSCVRIADLRGTTVQTRLNLPQDAPSPSHNVTEHTWVKLFHDGRSWVLEEVWRSAKEDSYIFLSTPAKRAIAAMHVRSTLGLKLIG